MAFTQETVFYNRAQKRGGIMMTGKELVVWRNSLVSGYYEGVAKARGEGKLIVHVTGHMPTELFYAMDLVPVGPEHYAPQICAQGYAQEFCQTVEERGFSPEVCGYSKASLGAMYSGKGPFGGLPEPHVVISCPNMCSIHPQWWDVEGQYYGVPHFLLDAPHANSDPQEHHINYFVSQLKEMVSFLEEKLKLTFSEEKLREVVALSDEANKYYIDILEMMKEKPCPLSFRDLCGHVFPVSVLSGTQTAVDFYAELREFVADRVKKGIGAVENEKYRLAWDNIAIWHDMQLLSHIEGHGASIVYSTYPSGTWGQRLDVDHPFESLARKYLIGWVNRLVKSQIDVYRKKIREYSVDGVIFFVNRGCRPYTAGQYDLAKTIKERLACPALCWKETWLTHGDIPNRRLGG